jgi:hypothetical protein
MAQGWNDAGTLVLRAVTLPASSLRWATNNTKLNRGIYSIQFVFQLLRRRELIFVNLKQRPPLSGRKRIVDFEAPLRLLFHSHT